MEFMVAFFIVISCLSLLGLTLVFRLGCNPFMWFLVKENEVAILEKFGKFVRGVDPGIRKRSLFEKVVTRFNLAATNFSVSVCAFTSDKVPVELSVEASLKPIDAIAAYYKSSDLLGTGKSALIDAARETVARYLLTDVYKEEEKLVALITPKVNDYIKPFGCKIRAVRVTFFTCDTRIIDSMNGIAKGHARREFAVNEAKGEVARQESLGEARKEQLRIEGKSMREEQLSVVKGIKKVLDDYGSEGENVLLELVERQVENLNLDSLTEVFESDALHIVMMPNDSNDSGNETSLLKTLMTTRAMDESESSQKDSDSSKAVAGKSARKKAREKATK